MSFLRKKWRLLLIPLFIFSGMMFLLDGCMQFRMSKSEINQYFADKKVKGTLHQYRVESRLINYLEVGSPSAPLVLFVHGSPGSLSAFIHFTSDTALLSRAQVIAVDRPGFGSSNFGYAERSLQKQAALLKPILEMHKTQRPVILVGHSLGAPLIARMAMDYPDLIDGIVMVAPSIDPELEPYEWFRAPMATPFLKWLLPRSIRASNDEIYNLKTELEEMLPLWTTIHTPTIVIQGGKDTLVDPGNAAFAKQKMNNAIVKVVFLADMNHFIPWTNPELIRQAVIEQLENLHN